MSLFKKLDNLFRRLKRRQIVGVRGLCCGSCSACEGGNRMDADESLVGYVYYHVQDVDGHKSNGRGIYLGYGGRDASDESAVKIGQTIYMQAVETGLKVEWDGSVRNRIRVNL